MAECSLLPEDLPPACPSRASPVADVYPSSASPLLMSHIVDTDMGASDPLSKEISLPSEASSDSGEELQFLDPLSSQLLPTVFKAVSQLTSQDREDATTERQKNQHLLNFILAQGFYLDEVNSFAQKGDFIRAVDDNNFILPHASVQDVPAAPQVFDDMPDRNVTSVDASTKA